MKTTVKLAMMALALGMAFSSCSKTELEEPVDIMKTNDSRNDHSSDPNNGGG